VINDKKITVKIVSLYSTIVSYAKSGCIMIILYINEPTTGAYELLNVY
jgi:hypothetical protein